MDKKIPLYKIKINEFDETGVSQIALVNSPAIEINWLAFNKQDVVKEVKFKANIEQRKLAGPLIVPDKPIYRYNEEMGEYYVQFDKETIQAISDKFNKTSKTHSINLEHSKRMVDAYVSENWIVDGEDKSSKYGFSVEDGTWFGIIKIDDEEFWNNYVKTGEVLGFSVEGLLGLSLEKMAEQIRNVELGEGAEGSNLYPPCHPNCKCFIETNGDWNFSTDEGSPCEICQKNKATYMKSGIRKRIRRGNFIKIKIKNSKMEQMKFVEAVLADGTKIQSDAELLDIGVEVYTTDEAGVKTPVADGEYVLESGETLTIAGSVITAITEKPEVVVEEEQSAEPVEEVKAGLDPAIQSYIDEALKPLMDKISALENSGVKMSEENVKLTSELEKFSLLAGSESITNETPIVKQSYKEHTKMEMASAIDRVRSLAKK